MTDYGNNSTTLVDVMTPEYCAGALLSGKARATEQQAAGRHLSAFIERVEDLQLINAELTDALIAANLDRAELRDPDLNNARVTREPVADSPDER